MLQYELEKRPLDDSPPKPCAARALTRCTTAGDLVIYRPLVASGRQVPIYVGKAEAGKSSCGEATDENGFQLYGRAVNHSSHCLCDLNHRRQAPVSRPTGFSRPST